MPKPTYKLLPLPYPTDFIEPVIDKKTIELHHSKHEQAYIDGLNEATKNEDVAVNSSVSDKTRQEMRVGIANELAFCASGLILHRLYFENITKVNGGTKPTLALHNRIGFDFSSPSVFMETFNDLACSIKGSGWVALSWVPYLQRLMVLQIKGNCDGWVVGAQPIIVLDMWEHSYYLKYNDNKAEYVKNFWSILNWNVASARFAQFGSPR